MICINCQKESGTPGAGIMLKRSGTVPGTHGMPRFIALCGGCSRKESEKAALDKAEKQYGSASRG